MDTDTNTLFADLTAGKQIHVEPTIFKDVTVTPLSAFIINQTNN